jgi:amino acid adenylation domain-containing protein
VLSDPERNALLDQGRGAVVVEGFRPVPDAIHDVAQRVPDRIAVHHADSTLTYAELDRRSSELAVLLRDRGVRPEVRVGVCLRRDPDLVVALVAILKAGGAYVPLDPEYPARRLAGMVADADPAVVITQSPFATLFDGAAARLLLLDEETGTLADANWSPHPDLGPDNAAYVLYTSGSTGSPKGTVVDHRSLSNLMSWSRAVLTDTELDGMLASSSVCFDASVWELWSPLVLGGVMVLVDDVLALDALPEPVRQRVTLVNTVPSAAIELVRAGFLPPGVHTVTTGGESLPGATARALYEYGVRRVLNLYGPAEATVYSTYSAVAADVPDGGVPIGGPLPNVRVYILDRFYEPVPVDVPGELYIAGAGVARGYAARPGLTAARFVPDPHADRPGERMYRTGDVVRWRTDGTIDFVGRSDGQVKVRGFRIELGDVETALRAHPDIAAAAAGPMTDAGGTRVLVGYFVPRRDVTEAAVRDFLTDRLPKFMVPTHLVRLADLPRTPSGKLDRSALPRPDQRTETPDTTPQDWAERVVLDTWRSVLCRDDIGPNQNFFDVGGHSLLLLRVHDALAKTLGRRIPIVDLFRYSTVTALANHLRQNRPSDTEEARQPGEQGEQASVADTAVAVIGMALRFPGAADPDRFWTNLVDGVESITTFDDEQVRAAGLDPAAPGFVPRAGDVAGIEEFDAEFFGYGPLEAELLDPQQRLLLECTADALERAGYDTSRYPGRIGTYVGVGFNDYFWTCLADHEGAISTANGLLLQTSVDKDFAATRVAYKLNLRGPALTVQSACSTSLAAAHLAYQAVRTGECDIAVAGGANIRFPNVGYPYEHGGVNSPDGHCRPYDSTASGVVPGNGVGIVVLKRLTEAITDGDVVHAVILGSGMTNDGAGKVGYTAPSVSGHADAVRRALDQSSVDPGTVGLVEGHGSATELGDPIEIAALTDAYRGAGTGGCAIGSLKANVGHLGVTAGVAGLIKAVLAVRNGVVPPATNFLHPNPNLPLGDSPFHVPTTARPWPAGPRRAGVSSLGMGGTNVHMIVGEAPPRAAVRSGRPWQVLPLSARSVEALAQVATRLAEHLDRYPDELADVAHTLQTGRTRHAVRRFVVAANRADAVRQLRTAHSGGTVGDTVVLGDDLPLVPGQLAALYWRLPVVRSAVDECAEVATRSVGWDPREDYLLGSGRAENPAVARFVVRYALGRAVMAAAPGVRVLGAGSAAGVAECLAGRLALADAMATDTFGPAAVRGAVPLYPDPDDELEPQFLAAIGALWSGGADVRWETLTGAPRRRTVELPTYPFERTRHWLPDRAATQGVRREPDPRDWFYQPSWRPTVQPLAPADPAGRYVVIARPQGFGALVADALRARGAEVVTSDHVEVLEQPELPTTIVYCLATGPAPSPDARTEAAVGLLALARELAAHLGPAEFDLCVVTEHGLPAPCDRDVVPEHGMLAGLCRVIPQELPRVRCRHIDVAEDQIEDLVEELITGTDRTVALRDRRRWVGEYAATRPAEPGPASLLRPGGHYLVVGGRGRIGRVVADHLVSLVGARISAVQRSGTAAERADVSDPDAFRAAVEAAEGRYGPIDGVFHLADVLDDNLFTPIPATTPESGTAHWRAKVAGANVIADVFADRRPDFVLLGSSLSAVLGGIGFGAYAAANTYLDLFAHHQNATGPTRWASVNWEGWLPAEPAAHGVLTRLGAGAAHLALTDDDGRRVLDRLLAGRLPTQVVVSTGSLPRRLDHWVHEPARPPVPARHPRPPLRVAYEPPTTGTEATLVDIWQSVLNVEPVGVRDDFFDLGGSSMLAVQLVDTVQRQLGQPVRLSTVLAAHTVAGLAAELSTSDEPVDRPLVPLGGEGCRRLFMVHPLTGGVLCYAALARELGTGWSCYGLQMPGLWEDVAPDTTVEDLAERYVQEVRSIQRTGPYHVGGWSAGGPIAFEVAHRLRAYGEVATVAVVEALAPGPEFAASAVDDAAIIRALADARGDDGDVPPLPERLHRGTTRDRIARFAAWARSSGVDQWFTDVERAGRLYLVSRTVRDAYRRYEPGHYPGRVDVFRATARGDAGGPALGWDAFADTVVPHDLPGDHESIVEEPGVGRLAAVLRSVLESREPASVQGTARR